MTKSEATTQDRSKLDGLPFVPDKVEFAPQTDDSILVTKFTDAKKYHPGLIKKILELESSTRAAQKTIPGSCGTKIYDVDAWTCDEADFLNERVVRVVSGLFKAERVIVDLSWASVYRRRDYCMPHAHVRAKASAVYFLDMGDPVDRKKDPFGGRFCFMDPRIAFCCKNKPGFPTRPLFPNVEEGSLIVFPPELIHLVSPYWGKKPRITLSWDITDEVLAGSPLKDFKGF